MSTERYTVELSRLNVDFEQVTHEPIRTVADVAAFAPKLLATMVKTIAFRVKGGGLLLVAVRGADRIDYKRVAQHAGVNRRDLRSLAPDEVSAELGVQPGGVAPIPFGPDQQLIIDSNVYDMPLIHTGSGRFDVTLALDPKALADAFNAAVLGVTK